MRVARPARWPAPASPLTAVLARGDILPELPVRPGLHPMLLGRGEAPPADLEHPEGAAMQRRPVRYGCADRRTDLGQQPRQVLPMRADDDGPGGGGGLGDPPPGGRRLRPAVLVVVGGG